MIGCVSLPSGFGGARATTPAARYFSVETQLGSKGLKHQGFRPAEGERNRELPRVARRGYPSVQLTRLPSTRRRLDADMSPLLRHLDGVKHGGESGNGKLARHPHWRGISADFAEAWP